MLNLKVVRLKSSLFKLHKQKTKLVQVRLEFLIIDNLTQNLVQLFDVLIILV